MSEGKRLRDSAKLIDKEIKRQEEMHPQDPHRLSWRRWQVLLQERKEAWDRAEEVSDAAGHPYKNRDGVWVNGARADLVSRCLREWCKRHDLQTS